jgi:DNA polymerase V
MTAILLGRADTSTTCWLPLVLSRVPAGFPSPADDFIEGLIDLNSLLRLGDAATFLMRASGESMKDAGIHDGDILVVSRADEPKNGDVVVAAVDGEFTVKVYRVGQKSRPGRTASTGDGAAGQAPGLAPYDGRRKRLVWLEPANPDFEPIYPAEGSELRVWGVVKHTLHSFGRP